jgi:apolipoprotein D and lipocalin family protein
MWFRRVLAALVAGCFLLGTHAVRASDSFPETIRAQLQLPAAPPCTICHRDDEGGFDTVVKPFGVSMIRLGAVATDPNSLLAALASAESDGTDSDFDDVSDIQELRDGTDPNDGVDLPTPMTGCATRGTPTPGSALLGLPLVLFVLMRRHARRAAQCLVALTLAQLIGCNEAGPEVEKDFDIARFEGRWYEIARVPRDYDADCHDTVADYRLTPSRQLDVRHTCFIESPSGPLHEFRAVASVDDRAEPAKMSLQIGLYTGAYWVLDVGARYEYALVGHPARTALWVLSRRPTLSETEWKHALSVARSRGYDTGRLRKTPQSAAR